MTSQATDIPPSSLATLSPRTLLRSGIRPLTTLSWVSNSYAPYGETVRKWLENIHKRLYYSTYTNYGSAIDKI